MAHMLRMPRSRGMLSGLLLVLLGVWAGLIPFVGPYFSYAYAPNNPWTYSVDRLWLMILPAIGTLIGGLLVLASANRVSAVFGGWLAAISGAWLIVGVPLSPIWRGMTNPVGAPIGGAHRAALEMLGMFVGLGAVVVFFAALSLGRFLVLGATEERRRQAEVARGDTARAAGYRAGRGGEPAPAPEPTEQEQSSGAHAAPPRSSSESGGEG